MIIKIVTLNWKLNMREQNVTFAVIIIGVVVCTLSHARLYLSSDTIFCTNNQVVLKIHIVADLLRVNCAQTIDRTVVS